MMSHELALEKTEPGLSREILKLMPELVLMQSPRTGAWNCYQDRELRGAIGCTAYEGEILNRLMCLGKFRRALEIGSYVGWSTAHLLYGNASRLTCVDSFTEGNGFLHQELQHPVRDRFIGNMSRLGFLERIQLHQGRSPDILADIAPPGKWQFVFVDGWHLDGQPKRDVEGLLPHINDRSIVAFHDSWMPDVWEGIEAMLDAGYSNIRFGTDNELSFCYKKTPVWWSCFVEGVESCA